MDVYDAMNIGHGDISWKCKSHWIYKYRYNTRAFIFDWVMTSRRMSTLIGWQHLKPYATFRGVCVCARMWLSVCHLPVTHDSIFPEGVLDGPSSSLHYSPPSPESQTGEYFTPSADADRPTLKGVATHDTPMADNWNARRRHLIWQCPKRVSYIEGRREGMVWERGNVREIGG